MGGQQTIYLVHVKILFSTIETKQQQCEQTAFFFQQRTWIRSKSTARQQISNCYR